MIRKPWPAQGTADVDNGNGVRVRVRVRELFAVDALLSVPRGKLNEMERNWVGGRSGKTKAKMQMATKKQSWGFKGWSIVIDKARF